MSEKVKAALVRAYAASERDIESVPANLRDAVEAKRGEMEGTDE